MVRMLVSGVRSSCEASATRFRCAATDRSSDASISFTVAASRLSSSSPVTSILRERSAVRVISSAVTVSRRTGCSAERATRSPRSAAPDPGDPDHDEDRAETAQGLVHLGERSRHEHRIPRREPLDVGTDRHPGARASGSPRHDGRRRLRGRCRRRGRSRAARRGRRSPPGRSAPACRSSRAALREAGSRSPPACRAARPPGPSPGARCRPGRRGRHARSGTSRRRRPAMATATATAATSVRRARKLIRPRVARSRRREPCAGAATRHPLRACGRGTRRRPRASSTSARSRSPTPGRRSARGGTWRGLRRNSSRRRNSVRVSSTSRSQRRTSRVAGSSDRSAKRRTP